MGIIGVVAALTLPNLNSSTGDKEKVAKVKKIYSNMSDAVGRAQVVYGPVDEWCVNYSGNCSARSFDRISEFLKTSKKCDTVTSCSIELDENGSGASSNYAVVLADGSVIILEWVWLHNGVYWLNFTFDIDGVRKGPNKGGYDVFSFGADKNGVFTYNFDGDNFDFSLGQDVLSDNSLYVKKRYNTYFNPSNAMWWIINFDNMDYLKTSDGTTCPDGKTKLTVGGNHSCK